MRRACPALHSQPPRDRHIARVRAPTACVLTARVARRPVGRRQCRRRRVHWNLCAGTSVREAVRFVAASQPYAGAFLNAIPMRQPFRIPTWALRMQVQWRLGLPITAGLNGATSRHGKQFDALGDVAQNDGRAGHAHRHAQVLEALVGVCRSVWGARVEMEPQDYAPCVNTKTCGTYGSRTPGRDA